MRKNLYFILAALGAFACSTAPKSQVVQRALASEVIKYSHFWVELAPDNQLIARLITKDKICPSLEIDERITPMHLRIDLTEDLGNKVCELKYASSTKQVYLGKTLLPGLKTDPKKIVVIGDTGCQISQKKSGFKSQNCHSINTWPFARIAASATDWQPDLVIHVGDYHYREAPCPASDSKCQGDVSGDNFKSWEQDFFDPAQPLLRSSPWIFTRGNHELCERGGKGWFKYFDPRPYAGTCVNKTGAYWLNFGTHFVAVLDSADDKNIQPSLDSLKVPVDRLVWLVLHRPFLTAGADDETTTDRARLSPNLIEKISVLFTGHQHHLSLNRFSDLRPPELISGNGGTELEKQPPEVAKQDVYRSFEGFGFLTIEKLSDKTWNVVEHDLIGSPVIRCKLTEALNSKALLNCE